MHNSMIVPKKDLLKTFFQKDWVKEKFVPNDFEITIRYFQYILVHVLLVRWFCQEKKRFYKASAEMNLAPYSPK